jgi:hypothetical protein
MVRKSFKNVSFLTRKQIFHGKSPNLRNLFADRPPLGDLSNDVTVNPPFLSLINTFILETCFLLHNSFSVSGVYYQFGHFKRKWTCMRGKLSFLMTTVVALSFPWFCIFLAISYITFGYFGWLRIWTCMWTVHYR